MNSGEFIPSTDTPAPMFETTHVENSIEAKAFLKKLEDDACQASDEAIAETLSMISERLIDGNMLDLHEQEVLTNQMIVNRHILNPENINFWVSMINTLDGLD